MSDYTTVLIHKGTRERLASLREYGRESYDEILNKLIVLYEHTKSKRKLKKEFKKDIEVSRIEMDEGKGISTKKLLEELGE